MKVPARKHDTAVWAELCLLLKTLNFHSVIITLNRSCDKCCCLVLNVWDINVALKECLVQSVIHVQEFSMTQSQCAPALKLHSCHIFSVRLSAHGFVSYQQLSAADCSHVLWHKRWWRWLLVRDSRQKYPESKQLVGDWPVLNLYRGILYDSSLWCFLVNKR